MLSELTSEQNYYLKGYEEFLKENNLTAEAHPFIKWFIETIMLPAIDVIKQQEKLFYEPNDKS